MKIFDIDFPLDLSKQIEKDKRALEIKEELKKNGKIHTAMNYILTHEYFEDLFEEYYLLNSYTIIHGYDDYYWYLTAEFNKAQQYLFDLLHIDCFKYWQYYYLNAYRKIERLKQRIDLMLDRSDDRFIVYFTTIKLDDRNYYNPKTINRENYTKVRTKVRKFIKEYSDFYVFNKDFGLKSTKRLHFHGCMLMSKGFKQSFVKNCEKELGFVELEPIDKHSEKLAQYLNKLSKHALKVNYGFNRENLIYSRGNL